MSFNLYCFLKGVYYNFKYLPFHQAIHLPIRIGTNTTLKIDKYGLKITAPFVYRNMIQIGVDYEKSICSSNDKTEFHVLGHLEFSGSAKIGKGSRVVVLKKGNLSFGDSFIITGRSSFRIYRNTRIGDNCLFSWDILVMDYDGHRIYDKNNNRINDHQPIEVGNHVWVGCRTSIWSGAIIPDNSIIGNNSSIKKQLLYPNSTYVGSGRLIKTDINWEL